MIKFFLGISLLSLLLFTKPLFGWTLFLQEDLGIRGNVRLCKYSDGKIYSFNATSLCKLQVEGSAPGFGVGMGLLIGERQDGMTKICFYDVLGERKGVRVDAVSLCPLNHRF